MGIEFTTTINQQQPQITPDLSGKKIGNQNLQEVTDNGATTDNAVTINNTLDVTGERSGGIMTINRTPSSAVNSSYGTQIIQATHDGDMGDGFGVAQQFAIEDNAGVQNIIGSIQVDRDGADDIGKMQLVVNSGGTPIIAQEIYTDGFTVFSGGVDTPVVQYQTTYTPTGSEPIGTEYWNATDETLDLVMPDGITLQIGQETQIKVRNNTGSTILNGTPVYVTGVLGNRPTVAYAKGDAEATGALLGVLTQDISNNADGKVTTSGYVRNIDTTGTPYGQTWADGDKLWVSKTVAGGLTNVEPSAPHYSDSVGQVVNAHATQGSILVRINPHKTLNQLSDVNGTSLTTDGQIPTWHNTSKYFDFDKNIIKKNFINTSIVAPTFSYTSGNLTGISYSDTTSKAITYNGDGTIHTLTVTFPDTSTVTKTFNWSSGVLTSVTIV